MKSHYSLWKVTLITSLFITIFGNFSFWSKMTDIVTFWEKPLLFISFFIIVATLINLLLTLFSFKYLFKVVASIIILTSAFAAYFMDNYSVMIDKGMIQNIFGTDFQEANELFSIKLLLTVFFLGVLPVWLLYKTKINYQAWLKGMFQRVVVSIASIAVLAGVLLSNYQELSFFGREHRELRHVINPTNYLFSLKSIVSTRLSTGPIVAKPIENDARKRLTEKQRGKPNLVILVLGETARSMNFSVNGYERDTNPKLGPLVASNSVLNFNDVSACGTATAVSVPCMFSKFTRSNFNDTKGKEFENLLDVVKNSGYDVLWLDNNTGCQGTCERVPYISLANEKTPEFCDDGNCVDEILLHDLQSRTDKINKDTLIVLHQNGNHGPTYHKRYPSKFEKFKPVCKSNQLMSCSREEVVNAYDNAILYSDYFLSKTIDFLEHNSAKFQTAMVYISDHGESLGEKNLYLHGLPYVIAPDEQKKVPFMVWLSSGYQNAYSFDKVCLTNKSDHQLSHDNFFSSMLGMLDIQTQVYEDDLDIFATCSQTRLAENNLSNPL